MKKGGRSVSGCRTDRHEATGLEAPVGSGMGGEGGRTWRTNACDSSRFQGRRGSGRGGAHRFLSARLSAVRRARRALPKMEELSKAVPCMVPQRAARWSVVRPS